MEGQNDSQKVSSASSLENKTWRKEYVKKQKDIQKEIVKQEGRNMY